MSSAQAGLGLEARIPGDAEVSQALVRRYFEMWNTGNWTEADAVLGPTYLDHTGTPASWARRP